jgi:hypothetical protein
MSVNTLVRQLRLGLIPLIGFQAAHCFLRIVGTGIT